MRCPQCGRSIGEAIKAGLPEGAVLLGFTPESVGVAIRRALQHASSFSDYEWTIIDDEPRLPIVHVALDEVLTEEVGKGSRGPTLRFWNLFSGPDGRTMLGLVRKFNAANPDVNIVMQRMHWSTYYNKLFVAGLGGRAPDVFITHRYALHEAVCIYRNGTLIWGTEPEAD